MAKSKAASTPSSDDDWKVHDAMHTMLRASEIVKDKKLMAKVRVKAKAHAEELKDVASRAGQLAKKGLISEKAMAKHVNKGKAANRGNEGGDVADLEKNRAIA